jgi:PKD repeat protein
LTGTGVTVSHTYSQAGTYPVTLTVSNVSGSNLDANSYPVTP